MNTDLISREDLQIEMTKQIAYFKDRANTTSIYDDQLAYNLKATGLELARVLIDTAPTVEPFEPDYVGAERLAARQRGYADELKQALGKSTVTIIGYGKAVILDTAYDIIDNAPTVEETYKEKYDQLKEAYSLLAEAYSLLAEAYEHEVTKEDRPQDNTKQ